MNSTSPGGPPARPARRQPDRVLMSGPPLRDTGLLLLRAVLGVVFIAHGLQKLGDLSGTEQFFGSIGIPAAGLMAPIATFTEIVGGVLLIVGLVTPLAGVALAFTMGVALVAQHLDSGFFAREGGYEYVLVLGVASLAVAAVGPGRLSLDGASKLPERIRARLRLAPTALPMAGRDDVTRTVPTA